MSEPPFLQAPPDDKSRALKRIKGWPSEQRDSGSQDTSLDSSWDNAVETFRKLPPTVQHELTGYPSLTQLAFRRYAETGSAENVVKWIMSRIPAMLLRPDPTGYIPIEAALESGNGVAVRSMLHIARDSESMDKLHNYRNPRYGHTLAMLAVHLDKPEFMDIFKTFIRHEPTQLCRRYDFDGRNILHRCTMFGYCASMRIIFKILMELPKSYEQQIRSELKNALEMPDNERNTPIHYISISGKVKMLDCLKRVSVKFGLDLDYDVHFKDSNPMTPLMVGIQHGQNDVVKWLLQHGCVNVHFKQPSTCLTALHFAVREGNPSLIRLLMEHGADPEFTDDDCAALSGYKTPLEIAKDEQIELKEECLQCLKTVTV